MTYETKKTWLAVVLVGLVASPLFAEEPEKEKDDASITHHEVTIAGQKIAYTATADTLDVDDEQGKPMGSFFYVSYVREGVEDITTRPVLFSFNGGPGAAAVWVHLGAFGPKKVALDPEGMTLPPPGRLVENPDSILDATDLVFIDPLGTGWSRPATEDGGKGFYNFEGDVEAVGAFIRLWVSRNQRWASPKLLAGESYGTTRAAGLSQYLQWNLGMFLNGIALLSPRLIWQDQVFRPGNDQPFVTFLPTYTATAFYHGKLSSELSADLDATLSEAEAFALGEYATALLMGDRLAPSEKREVAEKVARYTGLSVEYVLDSNLRVPIWRFTKELLRDQGFTVGRLDSRFKGRDLDSAGEAPEYDPSLVASMLGYVALANDYLRNELGYESDLVYEALNLEVNGSWTFGEDIYLNVADTLRSAMEGNEDLQVLFACGHYDLATPYFDCGHTVAHMGLPEKVRGNAFVRTYDAGHMMYMREVDHAKLRRDMLELIERSTGIEP